VDLHQKMEPSLPRTDGKAVEKATPELRTAAQRIEDVQRAYELYRAAALASDFDADAPPTPSPNAYFHDDDLYSSMKMFVTQPLISHDVTHASRHRLTKMLLDTEFSRYCRFMVDTFPPSAIDQSVIAAAAAMDAEGGVTVTATATGAVAGAHVVARPASGACHHDEPSKADESSRADESSEEIIETDSEENDENENSRAVSDSTGTHMFYSPRHAFRESQREYEHGTYYQIDGDDRGADPNNEANWDGDQMIGFRCRD